MVGALIGGKQVLTDSNATRVGMLDDHAGRFGKFFHTFQRRIGIGDVVVGKCFTL
ncbi:hypothetical protein D3C75_865200 [compost metagenome]